MRRRLSRFQEEVEKHRRKIWIIVAVFVLVIAAVGIGLAVALNAGASNQAVANSANGSATKAPDDAEGANSNSNSDADSVSGKAPCDPATTVVERERLMHPGMAQCSFVYLSKYPSVKLQATDGRYLGTGAAGPAGPDGPGSKVMLVGAESAGVWRFVTTADPLKYQLFLVGVPTGPPGPAGPSGASGASAVGVDGSGALVLSQIPANFVVTGVPDRYMIVFHGVGAGASGSLRLTVPAGPAAPAGLKAPSGPAVPAGLAVPTGLKALSGMDHESIAFNVMDDKWAVVGIYVDPQTVKVFEESKDEAAKLRALRASCCTRFGGFSRPAAPTGPMGAMGAMAPTAQGSCLEESDNVLKPMCCTECVDKLADCATRASYDAGPLVNREQCCASIQKLGVQRVYGDTECSVQQSECKGQAIDQTLIDVGNAKVYVPSFGEIAVARFLCGQLYFV